MPTEPEHHLLEEAVESILLDYGLLEETLAEMLADVMPNKHMANNYTPRTIFPTREDAKFCIEEITSFKINITQDIKHIENNMSDTLSLLQKVDFAFVLDDLYHFSNVFNRCTSFYKNFINDVNDYYQGVIERKFKGTTKKYVFEVIAEYVLKDLSWLKTDLLNAYRTAQRTKLDLANMATSSELTGIVSRLKLLKADVRKYFIAPSISSIDSVGSNSEIIYKEALKYLQKFQLYFHNNQQRYLDKAETMNMWRIPEVAIDEANIVRFRLADDEYWQSWPHYMDINYFAENQVDNILTDINQVFFDKLRSVVDGVEGQFARYTAEMEAILQNDLYKLMDDYKALSHTDNEFVTWVTVS